MIGFLFFIIQFDFIWEVVCTISLIRYTIYYIKHEFIFPYIKISFLIKLNFNLSYFLFQESILQSKINSLEIEPKIIILYDIL